MQKSPVTPPKALSIQGLRKRYPGADTDAVDGLNLQVEPQEIYGFLGPNGSGKTTTLSICSGILQPDQGTVDVMGLSSRTDSQKIKSIIGLVPQEIAILPTLNLIENLQFFGGLHGLKGAGLNARIEECLWISQLEEAAKRPVGSYSGGMMRRANLVAGLIHHPKLLFLDEPAVGVDPQSKNVIFEALQKLKADGMTIIFTTHQMDEAQKVCDRIGVMDHGHLLTEGTSAELLARHPDCRDLTEVFLQLTHKELRD